MGLIAKGDNMRFRMILKDKSGATAVEYGVITAIISIALLTGLGAFANNLNAQFFYLANLINY